MAPTTTIGQDWVDILNARNRGEVPGFAAHGAPIETADVHPDDREPLDVTHFVAIERPTGDWRDQRIAELEAELGRITGAPVDPRDARIAELAQAVAAARSSSPAAPATPPNVPPPSSYTPAAASDVAGPPPAPSSPPAPPTELTREPEPPVTKEELADLEQRFAALGSALSQARAEAEVATTSGTVPAPDQSEQPAESDTPRPSSTEG